MLQTREWGKRGCWREEKGRQMDTLPPAFPSFPLPNSKFIALTASRSFRQCWQIFLELNSKRLCQSSGKENDSGGLTFTSSNKSELRHYHVVVVQWQQRNVQKSVMHGKSCSFAMYKPIAFFLFSLPSPSWLLKPPNVLTRPTEKCVLPV